MKKKCLLAALLLKCMILSLSAQKRTNIWQLGTVNIQTGNSFYLDFSNNSADTVVVNRSLKFFNTNASICDTGGQLLFYTNGVWMANRNHDTLFNSKDFNPGFWTEFYGDDGLGIPQGCMFLPFLDEGNQYWLFHVSGEYDTFYNQSFSTVRLGASLIDLNLDAGLGGIVQGSKNLTIIADTLEWGRLTACLHANGRDWWVITHKFYSDLYYKILVLPDTIIVSSQQIGNIFNTYNAGGMAVFSPNGGKYAHVNMNDTIDVLQFDRCTGEFSNFIKVSVPDTSTLSATLGCSFSPNSRYLYVSTYWSLYQFDTWANDIQESMIKIGAWEDQTGWPDWFFLHQLASDGKIYISLFNATNWIHVINDPDSLGLACNFVQHGLNFPQVANNFSVPNFPNYELGPVNGSPCDTLYLNNHHQIEEETKFRISPNPVSDWLNVVYSSNEDGLFELYDLYGKRVAVISVFYYFKNRLLNVAELPAGVYLATVTQRGKQIWSEKVVVAH